MKTDKLTDVQLDLIKAAKVDKTKVLMMIDGFQTDEEAVMLVQFLWQARNEGIEVIFVPNS